jgi:hypothetical protein
MLGLMIVVLVVGVVVIGIVASLPWWGFFTSFMVIGIIAVWVLTLFDVWRRTDLSPVAAVIWTIFIFVLPLLTTMVYVFTRPSGDKIRYRGDAPID